MPIYWNPDLGERKPLGIEDYEPLFGDMLGIGFRTGKELNPLSILARRQDMIGWEEGPGLTDAGEALDLIPNLDDYREQISKPAVSEDEQARQIKESGLEGKIKPQAGYNQDALNIVIENAHMENVASVLRENASGLQMIPDFVGGMAASMIDPINLATAFFPAVPEQRVFSMLRKASGAWGRAGVRTATGVASGALGAAVVEPMISLGQHEVQADYDFTDSLLNIGMGAALGGLLHPVGGAFGDLYRNMHDLKHPWEYVPPNDETEALMKVHADEVYNHLREADPSANPDRLRKQADHYAALFDARARSWAYQEKRPVTDYYAENKPRYKSWQDFDPDGWRDLVPENWRSPGSKVGDELEDLSWVGKEYEGLRGLNADAMTAPQFLEEMGKWEERFPDMADYQGIRSGIEDFQARGMTAKKITLADVLEQTAWHGSPHRFRKFSLRHIGSGEGAQVHGWGLYFAADRGTATEYRTRLGGTGYTYKGRSLLDLYKELEGKGEYDKLSVLEDFMATHDIAQMDFNQFDPAAANWFRNKIHPFLKGDGRLYEVDVPDTYMLLDEQKTLAEQSDYIKDALKKAEDSMPDDEAWANMAEYLNEAIENGENITGEDLYHTLAALGTKDYERSLEVSSKGAKAASQFLDHFGIKGISYEGWQDGRCFVIFDDKAINITDTLYQAKKTNLQSKKTLPERFAEIPFIDAEPSIAFGKKSSIDNNGNITRKVLVQWAKNNLKQEQIFLNKDTGYNIILSIKSIRNTINHGMNGAKALSIPYIHKIIESGIYLDSFDKTEKLKSHIFANKLRLNNKEYIVGFVVREDANGRRFYDHELTQVITPDSLKHVRYAPNEAHGISGNRANQGLVINILRQYLGVNDGTGKILFQSASQPVTGNKTRILSANSSEIAQYELWELDDVIPSHDPERQFARREDYPEMAQERPYHSDLGEQEKVINNAIRYDPDHVANLDSMAVSGPPIITSKGIVLGGNSRTMTLALVYGRHPEKAKAYIQALKDKAQLFGLDAKAIDGMKKPILVRRISGELSPEEMALKSREYNQNPSQVLQAQAEGVSRARFIGGQSMNLLATGLRENESLAKFLDNETSAGFVNALIDEGVILPTEKSAFTNANGSLNNVGKDHVTNILRGMTIPDYDLLARLPAGVLDKLDVAIPAIALLRMRGEGWDISGAIYEAMRFIAMSKAKKQSLWNLFFQNTLGKPDPFADNAVVQALALTFNKGGVREIRMRMNAFLELARNKNAGQASLLGDSFTISPEQAFRKAFLEDMAFIGKERIREFDPAKNDLDAAIQWAVDSKAKTIEDALAKLEKKLGSKKVSEADKKSLALYRKELTPYSGSLGIDKPKTGEGWPDPGKLEFPEPKKTGEKGAMPEIMEEPETHVDMNDPDSLLPPELMENPPKNSNRGMVEFDTDLGQPVITLFKSADASTIPHEFFHIFRRDLEKSALNPEAGDLSKEQWRIACEFVGAKEGEAWTREMEEKFADAGLRYLAEGKAPNKGLAGIFERIKQWLMEIYQKAINIGVDISPQMRKVFDDMFSIPHDRGDRSFRYALGEMHARRPERVFANPDAVGRQMDPDEKAYLEGEAGNELKLLDEMAVDDEARAREALARLEQQDAEIAGQVLDPETKENIEIARREYEHVDVRDEARRQALECFMGGAS